MPLSIHQITYDTINLSDEDFMLLIGAGDIDSVINRRDRLREFLKYNKWELEEYKKWLSSGRWTPSKGNRGVGDVVAKIANAVGVKSCGGCKSRQAKLNAIFPYKEK